MLRKNKTILIITSAVVLLPILAGLFLWNKLPEQMPTHWNAQGVIDGWSSKPFAVFVLPLIMLAAHWVCILATFADPKAASHHGKVIHMVLWIIPVVSVAVEFMAYGAALGMEVQMERAMPLLIGLVFTIIGNYLPKCQQNYTIGIKVPWTLHSQENWNKTHRLAGKLWVPGGILMMLSAFINSPWLMVAMLAVLAVVPVGYSYMLYRKGI